jgi:predicted RecB family nuclease
VDLPELKLDGTPVYLDVEGLPDRDFYYLIGVRIRTSNGTVQHSFWANNAEGEKQIWEDFLTFLATISNPRIIYYGSYEAVFLKRMGERYGSPREGSAAAAAIAHPTNLLSLVYARIYFPTFSNSLKDIARYLGFQKRGELAVFELARNHGVRLADGAAFVACVFQTLVGDLRPKRFQRWCRRFECVPFGINRAPRHCSVSY